MTIKSLLRRASLSFAFFSLAAEQNMTPQWTWLHKKQFNSTEQELNALKKEIICAKTDLPVFTQLVFSWNALRPPQGYFTFYARVRNSKTKRWSKWHKMMSWGHQIQQSFKSISDSLSSYQHVRLEFATEVKADAFAVKIEPYENANLSLVKSFAISLSNFNDFKNETENIINGLRTVAIKGVPKFSQFELDHPRNDGLCSPTSCAMVMSYLLSEYIDPVQFAEKSHDTGLDKYGSWPFNIAHAFEQSKGKISFVVTRFNSFKNLYDHLCKGIPVVVSVRGNIDGAPKPYLNGHLLVVIGLDCKTKEVICHDPAVPQADQARKRYQLKSFMQAWERSHRLAYVADPIT